MKLSTTYIHKILVVAGFSSVLATGLAAQAKLTLSKTSAQTIAVYLENTVPVSGLQFTVNGSSNLQLDNILYGNRTDGSYWQIHQNRLNDSTINVVIINSTLTYFPAGKGAVGEFAFSEKNPEARSYVNITRAVIADQFAQKVAAEIVNIEWSGSVALSETKEFTLEQNFPNPFNPSTTIRYRLDQPGNVGLVIYDITGRQVRNMMNTYHVAGTYSVTWNGEDETGTRVSSGVYFARLNMNGKFATLKMSLLQ